MNNLQKKLMKVRNSIKLPKIEFNENGGFNFRNAEAMLPYIKAACEKENLTLSFTDDVVNIGLHNYVKTTLRVIDVETGDEESVNSFAREDDVQTMPASPMITGAASSYAHKYALQGLFAIDEGKMDPDTWNGQIPSDSYTPTEYKNSGENEPVKQVNAIPVPPAIPTPAPAPMPAAVPAQVAQPVKAAPQPVVQAPIPAPPKPAMNTKEAIPAAPKVGGSIPVPPAPQVQASVIPGFEHGPIIGQAPVMPDFAQLQEDNTPTFPWENVEDVQETIPFPTMTPPVENNVPTPPVPGKLEKANVIGVSYDIMQARAKIITSNCGIVYYRAFDKNAPAGPWSGDPGTNLATVDLNQLYADASAFVRMSLENYTGLIQP